MNELVARICSTLGYTSASYVRMRTCVFTCVYVPSVERNRERLDDSN